MLQAPPSAGAMIVFADRGGSIREGFLDGKFYAEARDAGGASELLDEIVRPSPKSTRAAPPRPRNTGSTA